jgi:hypothetical protein
MSDILFSSLNFYTATLRIYDELPALLADDWGTHQPALDDALQQIRTASDAEAMVSPAFRIKTALQPYPTAYQRLLDEMHLQATVHKEIVKPLQASLGLSAENAAHMALLALTAFNWTAEPDTIPKNPEQVRSRTITTGTGGKGGGKSVKFNNFSLNADGLLKFGAEFSMMGLDAVGSPSPIVMTASILLTLWTLRAEVTAKLTEQEASVFYGIAVACAHKSPRWATKARIHEMTNTERDKIGLDNLSEEQVQYSLARLLEMKSIARVEGRTDTYEMIENLRMEN